MKLSQTNCDRSIDETIIIVQSTIGNTRVNLKKEFNNDNKIYYT
jgi:hypothetical protein